jgi:hypothetical protein
VNQVEVAVEREIGALRSTEGVYSASPAAKDLVNARVQQWELYRAALTGQARGYAKVRAAALGPGRTGGPPAPPPGTRAAFQAAGAGAKPAVAPAVKGREFALGSFEPYAKYLKDHPDAVKELNLTPGLANTILNYVNGRRTMAAIRNAVAAETGQDVTLESVTDYLELLKSVGWVTF